MMGSRKVVPLRPVERPRARRLESRREIDQFFAERWRVLSAMLEEERRHERQGEPAQLELGMAA
jgi:hypothetical protein